MTTDEEVLERYTTCDETGLWKIYDNDGKLIGQTRMRSSAVAAAQDLYAEYVRSVA